MMDLTTASDDEKREERPDRRRLNDQCRGARCGRQQKTNCLQMMCRTCCSKTEKSCPEHDALNPKPKIRKSTAKTLNGIIGPVVGRTCRGKIDGSFEHGQFVSVDVDGVILKGVVFKGNQQASKVKKLSPTVASSLSEKPSLLVRKRKRKDKDESKTESTNQKGKKKSKKSKDKKTGPKAPLHAYQFYVMKMRPILMTENPSKTFREIAQMVGAKWKATTPEERQPFESLMEVDRKRYKDEKAKLAAKLVKPSAEETVIANGESNNDKNNDIEIDTDVHMDSSRDSDSSYAAGE